MPMNAADLETAIRNSIPVSHLEVQDQSSGCGESYAVVIVSEVCFHAHSSEASNVIMNPMLCPAADHPHALGFQR